MSRKKTGGNEVERLIKNRIREIKKRIKDKDCQQVIEENIRKSTEYENSLEGIFDNVNTWYIDGHNEDNNKYIIAETLLELPYKIRSKILDKVIFTIITADGLAMEELPIPFSLSIAKMKKQILKKIPEEYYIKLPQSLIFLNFKGRMSKSYKMNLIAHEIAHVILGHHKNIKSVTSLKSRMREKQADNLIEKWGFKRTYKDYNF